MLALVAIALFAADIDGQAAVQPNEPAAPTSSAAKLQCRREVPIGSIMPGKRICLTAAQWKQVGDVRESQADGFYHRSMRSVPDGDDGR